MKNYQYILFDWDGCIAKTLDVALQAYKQTFALHNIVLEDKLIAYDIFGDWNAPERYGIDNAEFAIQYTEFVDKDYPDVTLYEGAFETLISLKERNKKLALVTSSKLKTLTPALENNNVKDIFDHILTSEDVTHHKPDPEIIETALVKLNGTKDAAIIVGDSKSDLGAAKNAGIDSILFHPEHNKKFYDLKALQTFNPTYTITGFKQVLTIIR